MNEWMCPICSLHFRGLKPQHFPVRCSCGAIKPSAEAPHIFETQQHRTAGVSSLDSMIGVCKICDQYTNTGICGADRNWRKCWGAARFQQWVKAGLFRCPLEKWEPNSNASNKGLHRWKMKVKQLIGSLATHGATETATAVEDPPRLGFRHLQGEVLAVPIESRFTRLVHRANHWWHGNGKPKTYTVAIVTPTLQSAGAERWAASMARAIQGDGISCPGLVVLNTSHIADVALTRQVRATCPLLTVDDDLTPILAADAIILWGHARLPKQFEGYQGRIIYTSHSSTLEGGKIAQEAAKHVSDLVAVSSRCAAYVPATCDCTVIHNGVDLSRCEPLVPRRTTRAQWGAGEDDILVGYVGRYHADKHLELIGQACAAMGGLYRPAYVGSMNLREECRLDKIHPKSIFAGYMSYVGDALAAIDVLCLLSDHEAMSLTLCEAWAAGTPTVCTDVGAIAELQERFGQMTRLVKPGSDATEIAAEIECVLSPQNRPVIARARQIARDYCSEQAMGRRWRRFIVNCFEESNGR